MTWLRRNLSISYFGLEGFQGDDEDRRSGTGHLRGQKKSDALSGASTSDVDGVTVARRNRLDGLLLVWAQLGLGRLYDGLERFCSRRAWSRCAAMLSTIMSLGAVILMS